MTAVDARFRDDVGVDGPRGAARCGVRCTGYSSLAFLKRLPIDEIKTDKSFPMDMTTDADDVTIVRSTVDLARSLGLRVVAEGVETAAHSEELARFGCHTAQGYFLHRPLPAGPLTHWLTQRARARGRVAELPYDSAVAARRATDPSLYAPARMGRGGEQRW